MINSNACVAPLKSKFNAEEVIIEMSSFFSDEIREVKTNRFKFNRIAQYARLGRLWACEKNKKHFTRLWAFGYGIVSNCKPFRLPRVSNYYFSNKGKSQSLSITTRSRKIASVNF